MVIAKNHLEIVDIFTLANNVLNFVSASAHHHNRIQATLITFVLKGLANSEYLSWQGLNQKINIKQLDNTC